MFPCELQSINSAAPAPVFRSAACMQHSMHAILRLVSSRPIRLLAGGAGAGSRGSAATPGNEPRGSGAMNASGSCMCAANHACRCRCSGLACSKLPWKVVKGLLHQRDFCAHCCTRWWGQVVAEVVSAVGCCCCRIGSTQQTVYQGQIPVVSFGMRSQHLIVLNLHPWCRRQQVGGLT